VKLLVLAQNYPYAEHPTAAVFNERSAIALSNLCESVEVLVPRPYVPPLLGSFVPRWGVYAQIPKYEKRQNIPVHRPAYPQFPRVASAFWVEHAAFWRCRPVAVEMHDRARFDALLAFDIVGVGGVAWRLARHLALPAAAWVTGAIPIPSFRKAVTRSLKNLDVVFYQSHELLASAARLLGTNADSLVSERHVVLPRGIPPPPSLPRDEIRQRLRQQWAVPDTHTIVMNIGRIFREKGTFDLVESIAVAVARNPRIACVLVGANPAFDETRTLQQRIDGMALRRHITVLPACPSERVWEYLCAADIFAFSSHHEGMPNSLLEAMAMGVPSVASAISPVMEIEAGTGGLLLVPPRDPVSLGEALAQLADSPSERARLGAIGNTQVMERFMVHKNSALALERLANVISRKRSRTGATRR